VSCTDIQLEALARVQRGLGDIEYHIPVCAEILLMSFTSRAGAATCSWQCIAPVFTDTVVWLCSSTPFPSPPLLLGLLCYMLLLSGRSPSKILFTRDSGRVFQLDLLPLYGDKGSVERIEVVPYRLTRNLATFFTAFGVEVRHRHWG